MRESEDLEQIIALAADPGAAESVLQQLAGVFRWNDSDDETSPNESRDAAHPEPPNLEARYRTLVEQIPAVVFMAYLDRGMGEAYVSPHIESLLGFTQDEWLSDPVRWYQQIHPDDKERWSLEAADMFLSGQPLRSVYRVLARDGRVMWFQCEAKMVHRDDGAPWFIHGVGIDVTELKVAEAELRRAHDELETRVQERTAELALANQTEQKARKQAEEASRLKDEFLATVSHELRTPLTAVLGWACVMRMGKLGEAASGKALEAIERNARSQSQLIDDLLDVSRITAGKVGLRVQPVDLPAVIAVALDSVLPAAEAKQIKITTTLNPLSSSLSGDPDRLQQIVWNILSNAVKFTPRNGCVKIRIESLEAEAMIIVSDNGPGISPEFLPHVFERFRQADGSFTRAHGGLGLGLAIARHLVELHGGTIEARNNDEGPGANITIRLPLLKKPERAEPVDPVEGRAFGPPQDLPLSGLRILVVDDDADGLELLALIFKQSGATVSTAMSAREALDVFRTEPIELLVSDIQMPDEDGYELLGKILAIADERHTPLTAVAVTAHAKAEDRARALAAGYQAHVAKPVDPAELVLMLAGLAEHRNWHP